MNTTEQSQIVKNELVKNLEKLYSLIDALVTKESDQLKIERLCEFYRLINYLIKIHSIEPDQSQDKIDNDDIINKFAKLYLYIDGLMEKQFALEFDQSQVKIKQLV